MKTNELVKRIAEEGDFSVKDARRAYETFISIIEKELKNGGSVSLSGVGKFSVSTLKARVYKDPRNGESVPTGERRVVRFKTSTVLKNSMN